MQWFRDFQAQAQKKIAQFMNATFRDASMATCALIAAADGSVDKSERAKVVSLIKSSEMLSSFDGSELGQLFEDFCDKAEGDFTRIDLLRKVGKLKGSESADTCIRVALVIANADGNFDDTEKKVVGELCSVLGLKTEDYLS
jgi:tellurite resistance protein TerB